MCSCILSSGENGIPLNKLFPLGGRLFNHPKGKHVLKHTEQGEIIKSEETVKLFVQSMYRSLIEPYFRSCCSVWGVCSTTALNRLQKLQNRAARIATSSPYDASSQPLLKELGWPTVKELIETETARMVYRSINKEAPNYLTALFDRLSDYSSQLPYSSVRLVLDSFVILIQTSTYLALKLAVVNGALLTEGHKY